MFFFASKKKTFKELGLKWEEQTESHISKVTRARTTYAEPILLHWSVCVGRHYTASDTSSLLRTNYFYINVNVRVCEPLIRYITLPKQFFLCGRGGLSIVFTAAQVCEVLGSISGFASVKMGNSFMISSPVHLGSPWNDVCTSNFLHFNCFLIPSHLC